MNVLTYVATICVAVAPFANAHAITYGEPDSGRHPYVGLILFFKDGEMQFPCSGTLISPDVVLTAGHCTDGMNEARVWFDDVVDREALPTPNTGSPITHPEFDLSAFGAISRAPNTSDIGVVLLDSPVVLPSYGELPELGLLDSLPKRGPPEADA